ncbi:universal stress protein [Halostagnicola kamekurae]|uniref:Universal stress protein family protein n=1 Tax=Halostagnicola kamekurae TaxID=619731 RepID=A0A1I6SPE5_9EURY|nr:universal stress protein [Halostagnicola kamekurae]SFS78796.1 Universal stress protein family protein [Halostagnicola kamekurae]
MVAPLLDRPIVPVANPDDAATTYEKLRPYLLEEESDVTVVNVIEKAGGAPDKAGVEQRQEHAKKMFDAFQEAAEVDGITVDTQLLYGTDVVETINDAAADIDASAIVFASRGGGRWLDLVSGRVRSRLVSDSEYPVVVLP